MPKSKEVSIKTPVKEKIEYLGLNFERVPKSLIATERLNFKTIKGYDERQYKQYRYININDINILLTPKHRMDSLKERYEAAAPLYMYLDSRTNENASKHATFLNMLKQIEISEVEKVEEEQKKLSKELPYKVKFNGNYLWQIYYAEEENQYFMLVPTEDSDYSTFFYLLKKKIENKKNDMIFVPVSYVDYSGKILKKSEIKDIENYLWLFTKDYPAIYEVYDKEENMSLQIIGETEVYGKIKTLYKKTFTDQKEASKFFKLLKALFILQLELPHYYKFTTKIDDNGEIEIYFDNEKVEYNLLVEFIHKQYLKAIELKNITNEEIDNYSQRLALLRQESTKLEKEYLEKEKIISTYLECKKSFFGKVKYYFKFGKATKRVNKSRKNIEDDNDEEIKNKNRTKAKLENENKKYTLDELIIIYKELELIENNKKNIVQDINALKLKNKNLKKKIENATLYINEINKHKKSIFEFWKYSNKDEVAALEEGEEEEATTSSVQKVFDYDNDFESFGASVDKSQRMKFTDSELDSSYLVTTKLLSVLNQIYNKNNLELKDISKILQELKEDKAKYLQERGDEFDIFGNYNDSVNKEKMLGSKMHREDCRDIFQILNINDELKPQGLKRELVEAIKNIKRALKKNTLDEDIYVYKALNEPQNLDGFKLLSLNEEREIKKALNQEDSEEILYLYKIKLSKGSNFIALSNIIFYNNKNMTLPVGMYESAQILIDANNSKYTETNKTELSIKYIADEKDDFAKPIIKKIKVIEMQ